MANEACERSDLVIDLSMEVTAEVLKNRHARE